MLPDAILQEAYPDAMDPPVQQSLPGFSALGAHIPLRNNSALLVRERAQASIAMQHASTLVNFNMREPPTKPDPSSQTYVAPGMHHRRSPPAQGQLGPLYGQLVPASPSPHTESPPADHGRQILVPPTLRAFAPGQLRAVALPDRDDKVIPSMEAMEDETFAALKARGAKKRPAAARAEKEEQDDDESQTEDEDETGDECGAIPKPMKVPPVAKRPSGLHVDVFASGKPGKKPTFNVKIDDSHASTATRKNLASHWYCRVRAAMVKAGFDDDVAKAEARHYHDLCQKAWDKRFGHMHASKVKATHAKVKAKAVPAMKVAAMNAPLPAMKAMKMMKAMKAMKA